MGDTFTWATPGTGGTFNDASDWVDITNPGNSAFPGSADIADLIGLNTGSPQTVDGPADVSSA
jgi:hypothetical protein